MKSYRFILLLIFIFYFNPNNSFADTCIAEDLKVSSLSGKAFLSNGTVIQDLPIQLSQDLKGEKLIETIKTDKNGNFTFGKVKSGKYFIIIQNVEGLTNLTFSVKVNKKYDKGQAKGIKITMDLLIPGNCSNAKILLLN